MLGNVNIFFLFYLQSIVLIPFSVSIRRSERITLPTSSPGCERSLIVHKFGPDVPKTTSKLAYVQASLHADEIPGLLVANRLLHLLDEADKRGEILEEICVVPFANPIGLDQQLLESHIGRFGLETGVNFNRNYMDLTVQVAKRVEGSLTANPEDNVRTIRAAMLAEIDAFRSNREEVVMKRELFRLAAPADIVLDLHCDSDAVLHMYTHDKLWPALADLSAEIGARCSLLSGSSGGNPFDEACSCPWAALSAIFPEYPIPMACQSTTIELRGESDVSDELADGDARAIFRFLQRRGYIRVAGSAGGMNQLGPLPPLLREGSPLSGADMIEAEKAGVVAWIVRPGDEVRKGQLLGEVVDISAWGSDAPRLPVLATTDGVVFAMRRHKLVRPGQVIVKIAGSEPLSWRQGDLLTV